MYLCLCKGVTDTDVKRLAITGIVTAEALIEALGLEDDDCCGLCKLRMDEFVAVALRELEKTRSAGL